MESFSTSSTIKPLFSDTFIKTFGAAPTITILQKNLRRQGKILPKYFYRFEKFHIHNLPQKSRASLTGMIKSQPRAALVDNSQTKKVEEQPPAIQETTRATLITPPALGTSPPLTVLTTLQQMLVGNNSMDQGVMVEIKKSRKVNNDNIAFEVGRLMRKLVDIDKNTYSHLNRMAEQLQILVRNDKLEREKTKEIAKKIAKLSLQFDAHFMEECESMEYHMNDYCKKPFEDQQTALHSAINNLSNQIEFMSQTSKGQTTTDLLDEILDGTDEVRQCNSNMDKLLMRSLEPTEVPKVRAEAKTLHAEHRKKLRRVTEIMKTPMEVKSVGGL